MKATLRLWFGIKNGAGQVAAAFVQMGGAPQSMLRPVVLHRASCRVAGAAACRPSAVFPAWWLANKQEYVLRAFVEVVMHDATIVRVRVCTE